jgi:hypothetical protein
MGRMLSLARLGTIGLAFWTTLAMSAFAQNAAPLPPGIAGVQVPPNTLRPTTSGQEANNGAPADASSQSSQPLSVSNALPDYQESLARMECADPVDCYVQPQPCGYVRIEGGAMLCAPSPAAQFQANGSGASMLSSAAMAFQFAGAGNFLFGRQITDWLQMEGQFTGVMTASNSASVWDDTANKYYQDPEHLYHVPGNMFSPFSNFGGGDGNGIAGLDYNKYAEISCSTAFHTAELNFRRRVPVAPELMNMSVLFGIRYAGIPEEFGYYTVSDVTADGQYVQNGSINEVHISTRNEMVGLQIGTMIEFYAQNRWWLDFEIKAGLLSNQSRETSYYRNVNNGVTTTYESSDSDNSLSVLTDLAFTGIYRWSPHFTTRLGYHAVWVTNVALAQNNFSTNINLYQYEQNTNLNANSSTLYHGPFIGFDLTW